MSHSVRIDYESISIACRSICETAAAQLCKINSLLEKIEQSSSKLLGSETERMKSELLKQRSTLQAQIDKLAANSRFGGAVEAANALKREVNRLTGSQLREYETLLNSLLKKTIIANAENMRLRASGTAPFNAEFSGQLNAITDETLRGFIYLEWLELKNQGKSFGELKALGEKRMRGEVDTYIRENKEAVLQEIERDMREAKLDNEVIQKVMTRKEGKNIQEQIDGIREEANAEIVSEKIRRETLSAIVKCIEKYGFIIDRKNIKRQNDAVVLVAQKVSGQRAEFRVMLDGKFVYRFDHYEGQACQKDIQPFMSDLDEVYGIKVKKAEEIWRNPDKVGAQYYQEQNSNQGRA